MDRRGSAVFANERCRRVVEWFQTTEEETTTVRELTTTLTPEDGERERTRVHLYHNVLPRLEDAGLLEYDWRSGDVRICDDPTTLGIAETVQRPIDGPSDSGR